QLVLNTVAHRLPPGGYALLFPHQLHAFADLSDREIETLFITFETGDENALLHLHSRIFALSPQVESSLAAFVDAYSGMDGPRNERLVVLAVQTLLETIIMNDRDRGVEAIVAIPAPLKDALSKLSGERIPTAVSVAKETGLSEAYLRRLFKRHMGISLGRYLVEMRQNKARSLLGASDESVSRIAELCGFDSIYAFSRSFRAHNDCTPTRYRERNRHPGSRAKPR
ncbi:MAG: AraC family transcriptional regulator, partial [Spirochaetes bacterium]|nr:AraC family transcriptional regulator [Spirochaetota bacterium]